MSRTAQRIFRREHILVSLLIIGAVLGAIGVPQKIGFPSEQIILALLAVLALDTLLERFGYLERIETHIINLENKIEPRVGADSLFRPRAELPSYTSLLDRYEEIWMAGKNLITLVTTYKEHIQQAAMSGKRFRFLIVDPENEALMCTLAASISVSDPSWVLEHTREVVDWFKQIIGNTRGGIIEVRLANYLPTSAYAIYDGEKPHGYMVIEMYNYRTSPGEQIHISLSKVKDNQTFAFYLERFERMWHDAKPLPANNG